MNVWSVVSSTSTIPASTASIQVRVTCNSTSGNGADYDLSQALYDPEGILQPYADGNTANWQWDGTAENSASRELGNPALMGAFLPFFE